ncbi:right-handed parallel beta-helix repeat-containing protein [Streptomyces sp. SID8361]|uniref:hypothetical protein n=1 Tax=Streptomyces sp. MnatMP-M27 TaxID=1839768 RepID=UPI00081DC5E4|nr:hypothetical protein [Streptomyces sp. MnatMP-M27]MYU19511.1 right-handed parallel beta-helix repeat-containing protein [Streptomyces sp. SID8361]SCG13668.1 hypothetical protein GA0115260_131372 [Streptomyces sp. MnatMP-M27]
MRLATTIRGLIPVMALAVSAWAVSAPASAEGKGDAGEKGEKAAPVPCGDTAALIAAVSEANSSPTGGSVALTTGCVYTLGAAAFTGPNGADGLPLITRDVTISGTQATIRRSASAADFRIAEVAPGGSLTLNGVTFSGGRAISGSGTDGGGILDQGTLRLIQSTVTGNTASNVGGGIEVASGGSAVLSGTDVTQNSAGDGGGIHIGTSATLSASGGNISDNTADSSGGGVSNFGTTLLGAVSVLRNRTNNFEGGGIATAIGDFTINGSQVGENTAGSFGGGIANMGSTLRVQSTTVSGNTATLNGGGVFQHAGTTQMIGDTVTGNTANGGQGGGIFTDGGTITLAATTVSGNNPNQCVPALAGC